MSYFNGPFRASLHTSQCLLSLLHLYLVLEHFKPSSTFALIFSYYHIALAMVSFLFSGNLDHDRKSDHHSLEYATILMAMVWLITSMQHQLNAITWSASAFLSVIDLLNLIV
ncbi:hypothetical protein L0F63_005928 [Massospora cicadina]|nr:hypothetical protein L0F63_005928 [Massospora cicadina]